MQALIFLYFTESLNLTIRCKQALWSVMALSVEKFLFLSLKLDSMAVAHLQVFSVILPAVIDNNFYIQQFCKRAQTS